jgi:hypothetical protein
LHAPQKLQKRKGTKIMQQEKKKLSKIYFQSSKCTKKSNLKLFSEKKKENYSNNNNDTRFSFLQLPIKCTQQHSTFFLFYSGVLHGREGRRIRSVHARLIYGIRFFFFATQ